MKPNKNKLSRQDIIKLIGLPCLTFIIGFICVWVVSLFINNDDTPQTEPTESTYEVVKEPVASQPYASQIDEAYQDYKRQLESDNLLYVYVDNMYNWLQDSINASHVDSTFIHQVNGYHDIVQLLRQGKIQEVVDYQNEHQVLSEQHLWQIRAAYKGWRDESGEHEYDDDSSKDAKEQFEKGYKDIVSFSEIYLIHEGKTEKKK